MDWFSLCPMYCLSRNNMRYDGRSWLLISCPDNLECSLEYGLVLIVIQPNTRVLTGTSDVTTEDKA